MTKLLIAILNMSITASVVASAVMLLRIPLKKAPKIFSYALWGVVLFRLICPFSIDSAFSFLPTSTSAIPQDIVYPQSPAIQTGTQLVDTPINAAINNALPPASPSNYSPIDGINANSESNTDIGVKNGAPINTGNNASTGPEDNAPTGSEYNVPIGSEYNATASISPGSSVTQIHAAFNIAGYIWLFGFAALLIYAAIGYVRLKRRVYYATLVRGNIYETDEINTPFVLGFIRPKIYIPVGINPEEHGYIVKHEQTHIKRRDYLIKPFAFIVFALHWFNPLMWAAYFLMSKDIEMSCDEAVLRKEGEDIRCDYSSSLLNLSVKKGGLLLTPLAFGESSVKSRIKNVLNFKKPSRVIIAVALVLVAVFSVGFAVNRTGGGVALPDEGDDLITDTGNQSDVADTIESNNDDYSHPDNSSDKNGLPASETQCGNTSGNISHGAFAVQDGDDIYYVLPTHLQYVMRMGDLIKVNADGVKTVLFSGNRPYGLNIVDGWIYYIDGFYGQIYKMREDGTENTLITTADMQSGFMQGYTTEYSCTVETMAVVDDYIYCRIRYPADMPDIDRTKAIFRIDLSSGEVMKLQQLDAQTSGFAVYDGWVYYSIYATNEAGAWEAYRIRTDGTENAKIADVQLYSTCIENDRIYYIYGDEVSGSQIYSMDLDGANKKRIADGIMAVKINVAGDWIYYVDYSAVYKIKTDGTEMTKLSDVPSSNYIDMNILGDWIYLTGDGCSVHKVRTDWVDFQDVVIPIQGIKHNVDETAWYQLSTSSSVSISDNSILNQSKLPDGTEVCWYIDNDIVNCAYRKHGGGWIRFITEDSGYRDGFGAEPYSNLFGFSGFYIMAPRGAAYYAHDYYYFDADGKLQFLISGTYLDIIADFNNDGQNELLWFYHGGRDAVYNYMVDEDIVMFDIIEALSTRFVNWEEIEIDALSLYDNTIQLKYWQGDNWHNAQISFTSDSLVVQADFN